MKKRISTFRSFIISLLVIIISGCSGMFGGLKAPKILVTGEGIYKDITIIKSKPENLLYYTLDGSIPSLNSNLYTHPITIAGFGVTKTINVIEVSSTEISDVSTKSITIDPIPLSIEGNVSTIAGSTQSGFEDGNVVNAKFNNPYGITTDGRSIFIVDFGNNVIRKLDLESENRVTTIAGSASFGNLDGVGLNARFYNPSDITTDGINIYVTDRLNNSIRKIDINTKEVSTIAGSGSIGNTDGIGLNASFNEPFGITTDGKFLYVTDAQNNSIRKIDINTKIVTTLAGSTSSGDIDGPGSIARFNIPLGITTDGKNLYIADWYNHKVRQIEISTGIVTTIAGSGTSGSSDGIGENASFNLPLFLTTDGVDIYLSDGNNHIVRKINILSKVVTTIAGSVNSGYVDGAGNEARFYNNTGITTDGKNIYISDHNNHVIRKID